MAFMHVHVALILFYTIEPFSTLWAIESEFPCMFRGMEFEAHVRAKSFATIVAYIAGTLVNHFYVRMQLLHCAKSAST